LDRRTNASAHSQSRAEAEIISYIYVTRLRGELVGVVSLKEIILAQTQTRLKEIAKTDIISFPAEMKQEEVTVILSRHGFYALPVADYYRSLFGHLAWDHQLFRAKLMGVSTGIGYVIALAALFIVLWSSLISSVSPLILHR
jgi:Mg/Co/Ni transporter MgtE